MGISARQNYQRCDLAWFVASKLMQLRILGVTPMSGRMPKRLVHSNEREQSSRLASRNSPSRRRVSAVDPQNRLNQMCDPKSG